MDIYGFPSGICEVIPQGYPSMPGYVDLIIKMKVRGMLWLRYDTLFRQKRAKKIDRGSRRVKNWAVTDIVLHLACQPPRAVAKVGGNKLASPSLGLQTSQYQPQQPQLTQQAQPSQQQPPSQGGMLMQSGTCSRRSGPTPAIKSGATLTEVTPEQLWGGGRTGQGWTLHWWTRPAGKCGHTREPQSSSPCWDCCWQHLIMTQELRTTWSRGLRRDFT